MQNNQLIYTIRDNKIKMSFQKRCSIEEAFQVTMTGLLGMMNQIVSSVPEEHRQTAQEDLYDMFNVAASQTLSFFAPEIEMRPHLTSQAILEAENALIDQLYQKRQETNQDVSLQDIVGFSTIPQ